MLINAELSSSDIEQIARRVSELILAESAQPVAWLDVERAAAHLCTTADAVRAMAKRRQIPCHRMNGRLRFSTAELDAWVRGEDLR